jgi:hypothetical protein
VSFLQTVKRGALAQREATKVADHGFGSSRRSLIYGGTGKNWAVGAGDLHANAIVAIALQTQIDKIMQADPCAVVISKDQEKFLDAETLALAVLRNSPIGGRWAAVLAASLKLYGMAYVIKIREGRRVVGYCPFMDRQVQVDAINGVIQYRVKLHGESGKEKIFPEEDVIEICYGLPDPRNPLRSISPLLACLREVASENECSTFIASVLGNMGFPGVIISPDTPVPAKDSKAWVAKVLESIKTYTRDRRGEPYVAPEPLRVESVGFDASQMQVVEFSKLSIQKLCGALGVDPMAVGLPSSESKKFNSYPEARKALIEDAVLPLWSVILSAIEPHLKADRIWTGTGASSQVRLVVQKSFYPELNIDRLAQREDIRKTWKEGLITRGRALELLGEPAENDKRLYPELLAELKMASAGGRARYLAREHERLEKLHADSDA